MQRFLRENKWPLVVFLAAFFLRLVYLIQYQANPTFYYPMVDELWHLTWAREIIGGNFWGDEAFFRGPLYPYLLALFLKLTGDSIFISRLMQAAIGSLSAVLIYLLGQKVFNRKVGIISGLAYAAYGTIIFYETMFLIPVLFVFLSLLTVYLLFLAKEKNSLRLWLLGGFILGLAAIARPNILILSPAFLVWIYIVTKETLNPKRRLLTVAIYLLGIIIPIISVTLRNYSVSGEAIMISSQGGVNLYIGNNPETEGLTMLMPEVRLDESLPWTEFTNATREAAEKETGHKLTAAEESSFWTDKALKFIVSNPGKFVSITFKKLIYFLVGFENSDQTDIYDSRRYSSLFSILVWKKWLYFPFGLLLPLALIGMIQCWRERRKSALFYIFIIGYIPTVILFLVTARHRLPVIPFLLIFAAVGVLALVEYYRQQNWNRLIGLSTIFLILLLLANRTYFDIGFENKFQTHLNLALTYERQGNLSKAEQEYRNALEISHHSAVPFNNLGMILYRQNRGDEALKMFEKAIGADQNYARAYNNIGLILESRGDFQKAERFYRRTLEIDSSLYQANMNLGDIYLAREDFATAEKSYMEAKTKAPDDKNIYFKLGAMYARQKKFARAEEMFLAGQKRGEPGASDLTNWGNIYFSTRQPDRAIEMYRQAIEIDPQFTQSYFNLALTFSNFGFPKDSAQVYLQQLLRINPNFAPAKELLQNIGN